MGHDPLCDIFSDKGHNHSSPQTAVWKSGASKGEPEGQHVVNMITVKINIYVG